MEIDPQVEAASGKQSTAAKLVVRLKDGREITAFVSAPMGSPSRSFTRDEHHSRFKQELMTRISGSACAAIIAAASALEHFDPRWRSKGRRVGKECGCTGGSVGASYHAKTKGLGKKYK